MPRFLAYLLIGIIFVFLADTPAYAGMPVWTLSDMARMRISDISFFLLVYLLTTFVIYKLWNGLRQDFAKLPYLTFKKSLAFVFLWGLAFHLVLTMISGARELMTPKAWQKSGALYQLAPDSSQLLMEIRKQKMARLKDALWQYAQKHGNRFPKDRETAGLLPALWQTPDGKSDYVYRYQPAVAKDFVPLAYEPESYGEERLVLFANGLIELFPGRDLASLEGDQ